VLVSLLVAVAATTVVISIFVSWDLRRLSASRTIALAVDNPVKTERANAWASAQKLAPERETVTFTLFEQYLKASKDQFVKGNKEEALRLLNIGRDMFLEYEQRDPFELDTQIGLLKSNSTFVTWGYNEYAQEIADRSIKLAEGNPAYPTILGTSATALSSVGLHELAIKYAYQAIATENTTQPWTKAWYTKGRSLLELGRDDEGIESLITATKNQPGTEAALLSHQVLAQIYKERGETELFELHKKLGEGVITFVE
jgi:tetratricopeptide (TPR) repeat protein